MASVEIKGLSELSQALRDLPQNIGRNVLRGGVNAGATVIRQEAIRRAPVYTGPVSQGHPPPGTLRKALFQKQVSSLSINQKQVFIVGVRRGKKYQKTGKNGAKNLDAFYWTWVEFGTSKMTARPFLRPAFETQKNSAVEAIADYIRNRLPAEVDKLAKLK